MSRIFLALLSVVVFFTLTGNARAADWVETFDADVLASGEWLVHVILGTNTWTSGTGLLFAAGDWPINNQGMVYYKGGMSWTDYNLVVPVIRGWGITGVVFRYQDESNYYRTAKYYLDDDGETAFRLIKVVGGVSTNLGEYIADGEVDAYKKEVRLNGPNIEIWIDDVSRISVSDSSLSSGTVGASRGVNLDATWDEFQVTGVESFIDIGLRVYDKDVGVIAIACELVSSTTLPLRIAKDTGSGTPEVYGIALVDPADSMDSGVRIQIKGASGSVIKALRKLE